MNRPFLNRLRIRNYGCVRDVTLHLTPLHALVGPNDSGKSTVLRVLRTLSLLATRDVVQLAGAEGRSLRKNLVEHSSRHEVSLEATMGSGTWSVVVPRSDELVESWQRGGDRPESRSVPMDFVRGSDLCSSAGAAQMANALRGSLLHLDAVALRQPSNLIPDDAAIRFLDSRGTGLPAVIDAMMTRDVASYVKYIQRISRQFPAVRGLSLRNPTSTTKAIGVQLQDGTFIGADAMGDGLLYYIAFVALLYMHGIGLLLVESPEAGMHPSRIADVVKILRMMSVSTQVILATHSPLVINELHGDEVTVLTRSGDRGTTATRLVDTHDYAARAERSLNGDLWLAHCDGDSERNLLSGPDERKS